MGALGRLHHACAGAAIERVAQELMDEEPDEAARRTPATTVER